MSGKLRLIFLSATLFVSGLFLAIVGYASFLISIGWCFPSDASENWPYFGGLCNTDIVAGLIISTLAWSVATLGLVQMAFTHEPFLGWVKVRLGPLRLPAIVGLLGLGFLLLFFVPVVPNPTLFACTKGGGPFGGLCPSNPFGLESMSYLVSHWGAIYGVEFGYSAPLIGFPLVTPTNEAVLVFYAFPIASASVVMLSQEVALMLKTIAKHVRVTLRNRPLRTRRS